MELHELDLNLLVVFNQLRVERRVSKVADNLGISQPAVSNSLAKLRKLFGDELFLRTPKGMEPTPYAEQLAESVGYALAMIHSGVNQRTSFDPASAARAFTIGMTDIGEIYFLPALIERLRRDAPSVNLSTVRNTAVNLRDDLEAGKVDLAIGLLPQLKAGFFQRRLFTQSYVCLMRRGHRLDKRRISLGEYRERRAPGRGVGGHRPWPGRRAAGAQRRRTHGAPHRAALRERGPHPAGLRPDHHRARAAGRPAARTVRPG